MKLPFNCEKKNKDFLETAKSYIKWEILCQEYAAKEQEPQRFYCERMIFQTWNALAGMAGETQAAVYLDKVSEIYYNIIESDVLRLSK